MSYILSCIEWLFFGEENYFRNYEYKSFSIHDIKKEQLKYLNDNIWKPTLSQIFTLETIKDKNYGIYVCMNNNIVISCCYYEFHKNNLNSKFVMILSNIATDPEYKKQGSATHMIKSIIEEYGDLYVIMLFIEKDSMGDEYIKLFQEESNNKLINFFTNLGFNQIEGDNFPNYNKTNVYCLEYNILHNYELEYNILHDYELV
jgi:N-acetylglutamate synthase-like GNAT family acetyltransferase